MAQRTFMARVFGWMFIGLLTTALVALGLNFVPDLQKIAQMRMQNLLPTSGNPGQLTSGILGALMGGQKGGNAGQQQGGLGGILGAIQGNQRQQQQQPPQNQQNRVAQPQQKQRPGNRCQSASVMKGAKGCSRHRTVSSTSSRTTFTSLASGPRMRILLSC